jgi:sigma54-dependent transcription regulator
MTHVQAKMCEIYDFRQKSVRLYNSSAAAKRSRLFVHSCRKHASACRQNVINFNCAARERDKKTNELFAYSGAREKQEGLLRSAHSREYM